MLRSGGLNFLDSHVFTLALVKQEYICFRLSRGVTENLPEGGNRPRKYLTGNHTHNYHVEVHANGRKLLFTCSFLHQQDTDRAHFNKYIPSWLVIQKLASQSY